MEQIKEFERLCEAGRLSALHTLATAKMPSRELPVESGRLRKFVDDVEDTYIVRLFSVLEITLRDYWRNGMRRRTHPNVETLVNRIAARRGIESSVITKMHDVRTYRNFLVHGSPAMKVSMKSARMQICHFLSWLPPSW